MKEPKKKVFVAMSGGVDSSVAALLLKRKGYDAVGVFMRCFNVDGCAERDAEDARRTASHIGIPFYTWDFEEQYKRKVVAYMINGYRAGITPNPDVMCNREIKFGLFLKKALAMGADYVATGHYVRLGIGRQDPKLRKKPAEKIPHSQSYMLSSARDANKDQSYFLWTLTQQELAHCLFPIGGYLKREVRNMAKRAALPTADKKDSQGICFLGNISIGDFLKRYIRERRGTVVDLQGKAIGEHRGAQFYTIGQRHGFYIGHSASGGKKDRKPQYVAEKDVKKNVLVVAEGERNPALYEKEVRLSAVNFINPSGRKKSLPVFARIRYRQPLAKAKLVAGPKTCRLIFEKPQKFVALGQSAVFYAQSGEMLGGGIIA